MHHHDSFPNCSDITGPCDATLALHPHLPQRAFEMLHIRFPNPLQPVCLDQLHDPLKTCPDVQGKRIERCLHPFIKELDQPARHSHYTFFAIISMPAFSLLPTTKNRPGGRLLRIYATSP